MCTSVAPARPSSSESACCKRPTRLIPNVDTGGEFDSGVGLLP
jgi:hypothetical protein